MCEFNVDIDQLNLIYSDGIPNFRSAINKFGEAVTEAGVSLRFFNQEHIEEYLRNPDEIVARVMSLNLDSEGLIIGEKAFSNKIAALLLYMAEIDDKLDLSDYPELSSYINDMKKTDYMNLKSFDETNLSLFSDWQSAYDDAMEKYKSEIELFRSMGGEIKASELENNLREAGYSDEEIQKILESLPKPTDDGFIKLGVTGIALIAFGLSIVGSDFKSFINGAAGHAGDQLFNFTDTPVWLTNGPLSALYKTLGTGDLFAGAAAAFTIGTFLAFQDGSFSFETWMEEAFPAILGSVTTNLIVGAAGGVAAAGIGTILAAAVLGVGVTWVVAKFVDGIFNLPGGVPKDFDSWSEEEKAKYVYEYTGIDLEKLEMLKNLYNSGTFSDDEINSIFDVCTRDYSLEMGNVADESDYIKVAFYIYMKDKSYYDNSEFVLDDYMLRSADMFGVDDYQKIAEYIERFKSVLKDS